jgi:hypothetical protein
MELLIRRTVDTKLTERLYLKKTWDELGWDVDDIEKAKKLYDSLCEPVHGKFPKVWEQSKQYSLNNQKFDEFDEELRENLSIIFSQDWINKSLLHLHGIEGLEVYSFTKINETIQLVNYIVKKYPLSVNPK